MASLRRFIAILVLIAFLPATVMAGPLRLCLGQDGHFAVEFFDGGDHHANVDPSDLGQIADSVVAFNGTLTSADIPSCTDFTLLSAVVSAAQAYSSKFSVADMSGDAPPAILPNRISMVEPPLPQRRVAAYYCLRLQPAPQLVELRTVILLI